MRCRAINQGQYAVAPRRDFAAPSLGLKRPLSALLAAAVVLSASPAQARTITVNGTLRPIASVTLGSSVSGTVQEVACETNNAVRKGQVCARIDPRPFDRAVELARAKLAAAVAQLEQRTAALTFAKANYERNSALAERGVVARNTFEGIRSTYEQTQAQVNLDKAQIERRQAELATAELDLGYTQIASPIDGVVLQRMIAAGETVASNFQTPTLFVIATDLSRMHLTARIGESDIGELRAGDQAHFTVKAYPARQFTGKIGMIGDTPVTVGSEVTYEVVIEVENKDLSLKPGMTAVLKLNTMGK